MTMPRHTPPKAQGADRRPQKPITPQKIRAVLRKRLINSRIHVSCWVPLADESGRVSYAWSLGYRIGKADAATIQIDYMAGHQSLPENELNPRLKLIAAALTAAGIACEVRDGAVWVKVDQTSKEN